MSKMIVFLLFLGFLSGCAPIDLNYQFPTSMAVEYRENKYIVSVVIPSLEENSNKADKNESNLVIVRARGDTLSQALEKMNLKEKGRISASHIRSIIFHKSLFEDGNLSYDTLCKYFVETVEFRLSVQVYITEEKIDDLLAIENPLTTSAFNNLSDPSKSQYYRRFVAPRLIDTMINFYENRTVYLPSVYINENIISSKEEKIEKQGIYDMDNLCFFSKDDISIKCLDIQLLEGISYYQELVEKDIEYGSENEVVSGNVKNIKTSFKYKADKVTMKVKIYFTIINNMRNDSNVDIKENLKKIVEKEILDTYKLGLSNNIDIYCIKDGFKRHKKRNINLTNETLEVDVSIKFLGNQLF